MRKEDWRGRRVLVTGHTGFKGAWLSLLLSRLEAEVAGFALQPPTDPSLFAEARVQDFLADHRVGDVRDPDALSRSLHEAEPEVVFHLAAQPLVRRSYRDPVETYTTNVVGTLNLLEALRTTPSVRAAVVVTSDKCYRNAEWDHAYRESDPLGGNDPYSASKAATEIIVASYSASYFQRDQTGSSVPAVATVRAGNVIGGGDWAEDRLIPDLMRGLSSGRMVPIRNPQAIRPWQHVLEPLNGYLTVAEYLLTAGEEHVGAWNLGPRTEDAQPVSWVADRVVANWSESAGGWVRDGEPHPPEATYLRLDWSRAYQRLGWHPHWDVEEALRRTVAWYRQEQGGADARKLTLSDIDDHLEAARKAVQ